MNEVTLHMLEYDKVKSEIAARTMSYRGKQLVDALVPSTDVKQIERWLRETEEAKGVVDSGSSVPIPTLDGIEPVMSWMGKGMMFTEADFESILRFLQSVAQLKHYMVRKAELAPMVSSYAASLNPLDNLRAEITRCIIAGTVADDASPALARIRKRLAIAEDRLRRKLDALMHRWRNHLQEGMVMMRDGRYVLPVKKSDRRSVPGTTLDESSSGQTVFIEPAEVQGQFQEVMELRTEEAKEVSRILSWLTGLVESEQAAFVHNLETVGHYDFLFAKAKYAKTVGCRSVPVHTGRRIVIRGGRHPLLGSAAVPIDFAIGDGYRTLVITGPNTGGKTVSLKTIGLLTLMVQSGLLVPVEPGSAFAVFYDVRVDIGDGQSMEQALSTFSAHVRTIVDILRCAGPGTLVLLDELASGTDPGQGVGLAIAVLEALHQSGSTTVATTHFGEIKQFAAETQGFENARMEFDADTLEPLYRLRIGEAGESYAFVIAKKLGMPERVIARSEEIARGIGRPGIGAAGGTDVSSGDSAGGVGVSEGERADGVGVRAPADRPRDGMKGAERDVAGHGTAGRDGTDGGEALRDGAARLFEIGDRVWIHPLRRSGIVCAPPDDRGRVLVTVQKKRMSFNLKRLAPYLTREQLYPDADQYDLDIVLETKEVRKKRKIMERKHVDGLSLTYQPGEEPLRGWRRPEGS